MATNLLDVLARKLENYGINDDTLSPELRRLVEDLLREQLSNGQQSFDTTNTATPALSDHEIFQLIDNAQNIAFKLDHRKNVLWFRADHNLRTHIPDTMTTGNNIAEYLPRDAAHILKKALDLFDQNHCEQQCEFELGTSIESTATYAVRILPMDDKGALLLLRDVSVQLMEKKKASEALLQSERRFESLTTSSDTAIFAFNETFIYTNPALEKLTGLDSGSLKNTYTSMVLGDHFNTLHREALLTKIGANSNTGVKTEVAICTPNGETRWLYITSVRSSFDGKECWLASAFDITDRKTAEARLKYQAFHDQLTGLPNRLRILERIEASLVRASRDRFYRFAVIIINIDRFKVFNDSMGQLVGDQVLLELSKRIRICLRTNDMASRIGGDEFAVFIDDAVEKETLERIVSTLHNAVSEPIRFDGKEIICSASMGISHADRSYDKADKVLRDASIAMFNAKEYGKASHQFFDIEMHTRAKRILEMETDLRAAIRKQTLELYYQPIVCAETGKTAYFEGLIRWRKNLNTLVSPLDFIPLAEESGVILSLGRWVIDTACKQLNTWAELGHNNIGVSINVSGKQFESGDISQEIESLIKLHNVQKNRLKIEMTESSMIENSDTIQENLLKLRELGCELLVDDFGTGYSSLSYLHQFPINCIKIDRAFIANIRATDDGFEIVRAIINLAHNLRLYVIAEGVETKEQVDILTDLGCDYLQGYYFSEPVTHEIATSIIDTNWNEKKEIEAEKKSIMSVSGHMLF